MKGNLLYVQGNPGYHFTSQNNPVHYRFGGRVGHWVSVPVPPDNINKPWDFVIVDAPVGHNKSCPGRQIPIAWASQLAQKAIFVHDYERPWERKVCDRYLGTPSRIIDSKGLNNHQLAVFRLKKQASCATTTLSTQSSQGQPVNSLSCPICETSTAIFLPHGLNRRKNASCPNCFALERHRLAWLFFCRHTDLFKSLPKRFLHFAPESCLARKLQATPGLSYISADLDPELAMLQMDITKINFPDAHFDVIYCSHVLEHVADDRAAMRELRRVLTPAGWAIFMVPIRATATFEDPQIVNPSDRLKAFGQCDHVRKYGPDFQDRLREAGFKVNRVCPSSVVTETEMRMMAINPCDDIFYCTK